MEWDFGKTTKKCNNCTKPLPEEEFFFSALLLNEKPAGQSNKYERFLRQDFCSTCWADKPANIFSYWKTKISRREQPKTPREVLIEFFDNLINPSAEKPSNIDESIRSKIIYLFSLVLLRRKIFKMKDNIIKDNQPLISFERVPDGKAYEVPEVKISEEELVNLREQFAKLFEFEI